MRIWIGNEMEGADKGRKTMFVETSYVGKKAISLIRKYLDYSIKAIYLGAGRVDAKFIHPDIKQICKLLIVETSAKNLKNINFSLIDNCIVRIDAPNVDQVNAHKIHLKLDTYKKVYVHKSIQTAYETDLNTLQNGQFIQTDKEIYNNKKENN